MTPYARGATAALHHLKLAFPQQLTRTLVGAGVGGAFGAGVGALTGQSADPNDPLSKGTRGRNALIGGGVGAVLGGGAGFMSDKGLATPRRAPGGLPGVPGPNGPAAGPLAGPLAGPQAAGPQTSGPQAASGRSPLGRAALQLNPADQDAINRADYLGGRSSHDPSALAGGSNGMNGVDQAVAQGTNKAVERINAVANAPTLRPGMPHIPSPDDNRYMSPDFAHNRLFPQLDRSFGKGEYYVHPTTEVLSP